MPAVAVVVAIGSFAASTAAAAATAVGAGAIAASVGAVVGVVAQGVVVGAVIGAATSLVTGDNILKGALRGAAIGGITAGVASGAGMATGLWSTEAQLAGMGLDASAQPLAASGTNVGATAGIGQQIAPPAQMSSVPVEQIVPSANMTPIAGVGNTGAKPLLSPKTPMSPETSRIYAGMGQGVFQGMGEVGAQMVEADKEKELLEWQAKEEERVRNLNRPGEFQAYTANITPADWWTKYTQNITPESTRRGLLA